MPEVVANVKIKLKRDTSSGWSSSEVLLAGQVGLETDTYRFKVGDGSTTWENLPYYVTEITANRNVFSYGNYALKLNSTNGFWEFVDNSGDTVLGIDFNNGYQVLKEISLTPTAPALAGYQYMYLKTDGELYLWDGTTETQLTGTGGGGGTTINNNAGVGAPQIFNPDATAVTNDTDDYTLSSDNDVVLVTINGQVLDDSEYSQVSTTLTVTPDNGFNSTSDEVLVFQSTFSNSSDGGVVRNVVTKSTNYTLTTDDYYVRIDTAGIDLTLPLAASVNTGQEFKIKNVSDPPGNITVKRTGAPDKIYGAFELNSATVSSGEAYCLISDGVSSWDVV